MVQAIRASRPCSSIASVLDLISESRHRLPIAIGGIVSVVLLVAMTLLVVSERKRRQKYADKLRARQNCLELDGKEQRLGVAKIRRENRIDDCTETLETLP